MKNVNSFLFGLILIATFTLGFVASSFWTDDDTVNVSINSSTKEGCTFFCEMAYARVDLENIVKQYNCSSAVSLLDRLKDMNNMTDVRYLFKTQAETLESCDFPTKKAVIKALKEI